MYLLVFEISEFSGIIIFICLFYFSFKESYNTGILVVEGEIKINNSKTASENSFILFGHDGREILTEALKDSIILVLSGKPNNEPIVSYGPFVMNTMEEIQQTLVELRNGTFINSSPE